MKLSYFALPLVFALGFTNPGYGSNDNPGKDQDQQRRDQVVDGRDLKKNKVDTTDEKKPLPDDELMMRANQLLPLTQEEQEKLIARANANDEDAQNQVLVRVYGDILSFYKKITPETWIGFSDNVKSDDLYCYTALLLMRAGNTSFDLQFLAPLEERCKLGNSLAQQNLGYVYHYGIGVTKDLKKAYGLFFQSANQGNVNAIYMLGQVYNEVGCRDLSQEERTKYATLEKKCYQIAAVKGHLDAILALAKLYEGYATEKALLIKATDRGHLDSFWDLASEYSESKSEQIKWLRKGAEYGDCISQFYLAYYYEKGKKGVEKDLELALKWYLASAENGDDNATFRVGRMYHKGKGVDVDYVKAFEFYHRQTTIELFDKNPLRGLLEHMPHEASDNSGLFQERVTQLYLQVAELTSHFEMKVRANNPDNGFFEAAFALDVFSAAYTPLFNFGDQLSTVLKPLASVGPGFMVSCVKPCEELADACWQKNPASLHYDVNYMTFGEENVYAARQFSAYLNNIDETFKVAENRLHQHIQNLHPPIAKLHAYQRAALSGNEQAKALFDQEKQKFDTIMELNKPEIDVLEGFRGQLGTLKAEIKTLIPSTTASRNAAFFESDEFSYLKP